MDDLDLRPIVEALLHVSTEPLSLARLCDVLDGADPAQVSACLDALGEAYRSNHHGLAIVQVAGGYEMTTTPEAAPWIRKLSAIKSAPRLSKPSLETLAIIAYKQPLTRPEIEAIRGVDAAGVVKTLMDRRLIKIVGRKDLPGRPMMFGTTKEFLTAFGLNDLADLPTLRDFAEIARSHDSSDAIDEGSSESVPGPMTPAPVDESPSDVEVFEDQVMVALDELSPSGPDSSG